MTDPRLTAVCVLPETRLIALSLRYKPVCGLSNLKCAYCYAFAPVARQIASVISSALIVSRFGRRLVTDMGYFVKSKQVVTGQRAKWHQPCA